MTDPQRPSVGTDPTHEGRDAHAGHDELLIAALAADDLEGDARIAAERTVENCTECRLLLDDLRAIATATAVMPTMPRPRDFRLSPDDAARLQPTGWRRFAAAFASTRFALTRPLAVGLSTLGLVGLLISAIPGQAGFFGSTASAPQANQYATDLGEKSVHATDAGPSYAGGAPAPAASAGAVSSPIPAATTVATVAAASMPPVYASAPAASMAPGAGGVSSGSTGAVNPSSLVDRSPGIPVAVAGSGGYGVDGAGARAPDAAASGKVAAVPEFAGGAGAGGGASPLAVLSVLCLVAGVGLFAVRSAAGRVTHS
ncbi:MAG TPA: hypothetical protein VK656_03315 [Candidatus Acidoferrum sp.]|nr:hypothetical protein [Candidatus Acidoferrum sp.]